MRLVFHLLCGVAFFAASSVEAQSRLPSDWQVFKVPGFGTRLEYPASIFSTVGQAETGVGQRLESDDGRVVLSIYARENEDGDTPASYLKKNLRLSGLDYERVTRSFFAISMEREGTIYYSRCNFSRSARGAIHCFDLVYPQAEKRAWDPVVTRISLSSDPWNDDTTRAGLRCRNHGAAPSLLIR
jgi:hypothetical protein